MPSVINIDYVIKYTKTSNINRLVHKHVMVFKRWWSKVNDERNGRKFYFLL